MEANNFCLEDAIAAIASQEKKVNPKCRRKKIDCIVIDDSDADDNNSNVSVNSLSKSRGKHNGMTGFCNCKPYSFACR